MTTLTCPECEAFQGRLKEICRGEVLTAEKCNHYRAAWGLPILEGTAPLPLTAWQRIKSVTKVMTATAGQAITTGRAFVSAETRNERFKICQSCEHFANNQCALCGCACNASGGLTNKLAHASSECPIKKWGPAEPVSRRSTPTSGKPPLIGVPIDRDKLVSHILYHVMPVAGETEWVWRRHMARLREVRSHFNGRLIIGIVTQGYGDHWTYCPPDAVREELAGLDAEFVEAPNHVGAHERSGRGENILWPIMMEKVETKDPNTVVLYSHCKGVSRRGHPPGSAPHVWSDMMFDTTFRNHPAVVDALDNHGCCGPFLMRGGFRAGLPGVGDKFFFSGTTFAMRAADVFSRQWREPPKYYGGVERMPQAMFSIEQVKCLFWDNTNNLYDDAYLNSAVVPAFEKWKAEHESRGATEVLPAGSRAIPTLV